MNSGIYWIYQVSKDRALYVGSSNDVERRFYEHQYTLKRGTHKNPRLQNTWNKYPPTDFQFLVLERTPVDSLIEREQWWVGAIGPVCNCGTYVENAARGVVRSEETRRKISENSKRMNADPEMRKRLSEAMKAYVALNPQAPRSEEYRKEMSAKLAGRKLSDEHRRNLSLSHKAKRGPLPEETRRRISAALKQRSEARRIQQGQVLHDSH